jgi:hypothetical protein
MNKLKVVKVNNRCSWAMARSLVGWAEGSAWTRKEAETYRSTNVRARDLTQPQLQMECFAR